MGGGWGSDPAGHAGVGSGLGQESLGRDVPGAGPGDAGGLTAGTRSSAAGAGVGERPGSHGPWPRRWHGSAREPQAPPVFQGVGSFPAGPKSACPVPLQASGRGHSEVTLQFQGLRPGFKSQCYHLCDFSKPLDSLHLSLFIYEMASYALLWKCTEITNCIGTLKNERSLG